VPAGVRPQLDGRGVSGGFTPHAKESLSNTVHEAQAQHETDIGPKHLALGLIAMKTGQAPSVLSALGASAPALRTAIVDRYRQAS
ncbi:Clp protease N-terminal domain-containing protein, partial [Streptomyces mirabilis]